MTPTTRRWTAVLLISFFPFPSSADDFAPLAITNQSPLIQIYGLPTLGGPRLLKGGQLEVGLGFETASNFFSGATASETLLLDGETHRTALTVRYGTNQAEWGIEVPYLSHSGGFMDSFIENWHDTFGMPNGGRDQAPRNRLAYIYQRNGSDLLRFTQATRGVGDVRLYGAWPSRVDRGAVDIALRSSLKLPTGKSSELLGSGATDLAVWLSIGCSATACPGSLRWTAGGGVLWLGQGDILPDMQRSLVAFGGVGLAWRAMAPVVLKADLLAHSPFYADSALKPLDASTVQLLLGGTWNITARTALDVGLSEDLRLYTAPDVSLLIGLRATF